MNRKFTCPYDEQQCDYPRCINGAPNLDLDSECVKRKEAVTNEASALPPRDEGPMLTYTLEQLNLMLETKRKEVLEEAADVVMDWKQTVDGRWSLYEAIRNLRSR
jgi:hypothetical protein